jgi:hypothetical protein
MKEIFVAKARKREFAVELLPLTISCGRAFRKNLRDKISLRQPAYSDSLFSHPKGSSQLRIFAEYGP